MISQIPEHFDNCSSCPVSRHNPFKELPEQVLQEFSKCKSSTYYKRKQTIFHPGQKPYGIYCIGHGKVKESICTSQGKNYIVRISQPGDLLGYHSFLSNESYTVIAEVLEDAIICFLDQDIFKQVLQNYPQFNIHLLKLLSKEIKITVNKSVDLAYHSLPERVAELLLALNTFFGEEDEDGICLNITITRREIASMLGSSVESVVRELSKLKEKGILSNHNRQMHIKKLDFLYAQTSYSNS